MLTKHTLTGMGPVQDNGSRLLFTTSPHPYLATPAAFALLASEPAIGTEFTFDDDGVVTFLTGEGAGKAQETDEKKEDGNASSAPSLHVTSGVNKVEDADPTTEPLNQEQINSMFEARIARIEKFWAREGFDMTKYD